MVKQERVRKPKSKKCYIDNERFLQEIILYKNRIKESNEKGLEKPRITEYLGKCILDIAQNFASKPRYVNYSYKEELISDAVENSIQYFDNFDETTYSNPFAYFTQITYFAFRRRLVNEEKKRYAIYKSFQENIVNTGSINQMVDCDDRGLIKPQVYDNINEFIQRFEEQERKKKELKKAKKIGLEQFMNKVEE